MVGSARAAFCCRRSSARTATSVVRISIFPPSIPSTGQSTGRIAPPSLLTPSESFQGMPWLVSSFRTGFIAESISGDWNIVKQGKPTAAKTDSPFVDQLRKLHGDLRAVGQKAMECVVPATDSGQGLGFPSRVSGRPGRAFARHGCYGLCNRHASFYAVHERAHGDRSRHPHRQSRRRRDGSGETPAAGVLSPS